MLKNLSSQNNSESIKKIIILCLVFVFLTTFLSFAQVSLTNYSFEEVRDGKAISWLDYSWEDLGKFSIDTAQKHSGTTSAVIENSTGTDSRLMQQVRVEENSKYKITCWIKTENVGMEAMGANIGIETIPVSSLDIKGTTDWSQVSLYGETGPGQNIITVTVGLGGYGSSNTGKAWFDDIQIEKLDNIPAEITSVKFYTLPQSDSQTGSSNLLLTIIIGVIILMVILTVFLVIRNKYIKPISPENNSEIINISNKKSNQITKSIEFKWFPKIDKKDLIIMGVMTLVYIIVAFYNLGSRNVPTTEWTPKVAGESFEINLNKTTSLQRISFYNSLGTTRDANGTYRIDYLDKNGEYKQLGVINKKDIFCWKYIDVPNLSINKLKLTVEIPGGTLSELGFFEAGSTQALKTVSLVKETQNSPDAENLFDEQTTTVYNSSFLTDMYFDEIYHARTAYEFIHHIEPFENTHPPLGKVFIAFGVMIFGMVPFGWRIAGTLAGVLMIPAMYLFGKQLFDKRFYAFLTAFLMMFDFMHFTQTRIATIDSFVTLFVILMFYFMNWFFLNSSKKLSFKLCILPLLLAGISFGLGAASKWIAIYGAAGLAFMYLFWWFEGVSKEFSIRDSFEKKLNKVLTFTSRIIGPLILIGTGFFVIIPLIIYISSFIPFLMVPGPGHSLSNVYDYQINMYNYHKNLVATHPFSSPWFEWPFIIRPIWYYGGGAGLASGTSSTIVALGNPAIWWFGAIISSTIFIYSMINLIVSKKFDRKLIVIFVAIASQYLPWVLVPRLTFIYHYFSIVPFIILAIVYFVRKIETKSKEFRYLTYVFMAIVLILFIMFYPALSGQPASTNYLNSLKWFKTWSF